MTPTLRVAAFALVLLTGGCQSLMQQPPPTDPAMVAALGKTKADATPLFTALQQSTGCTAAANAAAFGVVETDLTQLRALSATPNNGFTQRGVTGLQNGFTDFKRGITAGADRCSPPTIVSAYQTRFNKTVDDLADYEQRKSSR
jgi:hypothetical protein